MIRKRPYSNYYKKKKYFLGGSIATVSTGSGAAVGSQVGMLGGPVGMMLGSLAGQGIGALASKLFKKKEPPPPPLNPFQGNTASSYGNFAMGGYAPLGPDSIKYIGPKHKDGGILIDEDGMPTDNEQEAIAEVEGGETRDDNYIFSDELKYPGTDLTFAEVHETMVETGASEQDIEELKAIQEEVRESTGIAAKERAGMQMRNGSEIPKKDPPITQEFYTAPSERRSYNWAAQQQRIAEEELRKKEIEERRARIQDSLDVRDPQSDSYIPLTGEGSNLTERMARETQALGDKLRVSEEPNFFDDYINPLAFLGELTSGVGSVPKNVREGNYGAAAFGIGAPLATGALAGIGARSAGQFANNLANPLAGARSSVKNLFNPKFTSEIDWRNWLKYKEDFDNNPKVIQELLDIERQSKANGTWMKNADGSPFQGTPEQFVIQQSSNFKKAFGNSKLLNEDGSPMIVYHGSAKKFDVFDESKFQLGDSGYSGRGIYTSPSKTKANSYALSSRSFHTGEIIPTVYELYGQANNPIRSSELPEGYDLFNFHRKTGSVPVEHQLLNYDAAIANKIGMIDRVYPDKYAAEIVFPRNTQIKSAIGNILFDMSNPNIYKSVLPVFGAAGASQMREQKYGGKLNKYQNGGYTPDPEKENIYYKSVVYPELLRKGISYAESLNGELMMNPESSATGLYGQRYSEIEGHPILEGLDREGFAKNLEMQEKIFNERLYGNMDLFNTNIGLIQTGEDLYNEYSPQIDDFKYSATELAMLANFLGRQRTREYLGYVLRDGRDISEVMPDIYGENAKQKNKTPDEYLEKARSALGELNFQIKEKMYGGTMKYGKGGKMIKRADGSYSRRGLWDNIRANKGSGKKPTKQMLEQERKIKAAEKMMGGALPEYGKGGYTVTKSDRKGKTHKVTGPDGSVKHFGDPNLKNRPNNPKAKKSWYARHKKSLSKNPHFRAYARATWAYGGEVPMYRMGGINNPGFRALPEEVQDKIRANMSMGGMIEYANGGGIDNPGFRALPMEVQEKIKANMAMGGELDYMYGGDMPEYKGGGSINIAPEKRGTFKAQATRMGMGVQEAASTILAAPKGKYSPSMRRKANFARNFAKKYGGNMEYGYGGKMKYVDGGQLLETGLQYLPEVFTAAKSIFGREKTPEPTQIARTRIPYQDTTFNINPQLQRSSASYRGMLADPAMTANQKMAAYSQKLQNEGQLYGQKENIENQRSMQLASQQAQLDAGRRQTQAGLDEQARQERMMNQANYGPFGNIMGAALSSASNKFLQQRGEKRYENLMRDLYGVGNSKRGSSDDEIMKENQAIAENNVSEILANSEPMNMTPLKMPQSEFSLSTEIMPEPSMLGSNYSFYGMPTLNFPESPISELLKPKPNEYRARVPKKYGGKFKMEDGGDIGNYMRSMVRKYGPNYLKRVKPNVPNREPLSRGMSDLEMDQMINITEQPVDNRRLSQFENPVSGSSDADYSRRVMKDKGSSSVSPALEENNAYLRQSINDVKSLSDVDDLIAKTKNNIERMKREGTSFSINPEEDLSRLLALRQAMINNSSIEDKPSPYRNTSPLNPQSLQDIGLPQINRQRIREEVNKYKDYANYVSDTNIFGLTEKMEEVANEIANAPSFLRDRYKDLFTAMSAQRRKNPSVLLTVPRSGMSRAETPSVPQINTLNENATLSNSSFDNLVERMLDREGGYVNNPNDRGGETNFGISSRWNPDVDVKNLTRNKAKQIYKERYWDAINAGSLPENIREQAFDAAVNQGPGTALKWLKQSKNPDGSYDLGKFILLRAGRYKYLLETDPSQQEFGAGWNNRMMELTR